MAAAHPASLIGLFIGIAINAFVWFNVGEDRVIGIDQAIGAGALVILSMVVLLILLNAGKIAWSSLALVAFDSVEGKSVEVAVEDKNVDALLALFAGRKIPIEPI